MEIEIKIPYDVYQKVVHWVNKAEGLEVSGFGKVVCDKETNTFTVVDAYLLEQEGGATHTDIDDKSLARLMYQTKDVAGDLRWWWHSHVKMSCFWSTTDRDTITELGANGWVVATVFNQKYEHRSALCYQTTSDFGTDTQFWDEVPTTIENAVDVRVPEWDKEYQANVKRKVYPAASTSIMSGYEWDSKSGAYIPRKETELPFNPAAFQDVGFQPDDADGLLGYGIKEEAKALDLSAKEYCRLLNTKDRKVIDELEDALAFRDSQGYFNRLDNYYSRGRA